MRFLPNATSDERKAILSLIEALLNGTLNGDVVVSDYMRIKNAYWNGTDLIFQIWWYNGTEPALIRTYLWENPYSALTAVKNAESGTYSIQSLENQFVIKPLSVNFAVKIMGVDYLTNDGSGEYVYIENPSLTTVSLNGWYILDDYAYGNQKCWANNLPRDDCYDSFGRDHVVKLSLSLAPNSVGKVQLATSPKTAILNNDGDTVYLIDKWGNLVSIYRYTASPNITIEDVSVYPVNPVVGDSLRVKIKLDNRGVVDGIGTVQVYVDGNLVVTNKDVNVWGYSIRDYWINTGWKATAGAHSLIVKFIPNYKGSTQTFARTFKVLEVHPHLKDVEYGKPVENHPLRFNITAENPTGSKVNVKLKLLVDGEKVDEFTNGFLYGYGEYDKFYLVWKRPEVGYHTVTVVMESSDGSTSRWEKRIYVKPNSPPAIVDLELPQWVYAGEESNGSVTVVDGDGDRVNVYVKIIGRYSFELWGLASGETRKFPLAPIYNRTNCREEITVEATPIDEYGLKGKPVTETITVITDSDKDGWCNTLELEYGTNPHSKDTDGDGVIDSKDVDPLRDVKVTVYILRARALDDVDSSIIGHNPADMSLELTVNGRTKTLFLTDNQDDYEKKILPTDDILINIQNYAIAKATFDVPDDKELATIEFHLYDRDNKEGIGRTEMDVSPGKGTVATIYYNLKTGTWSGDDYPGDEEKYFGYGHLSGCGDSSCNVGPRNPDKDLKVYVKYEGILEKAGIRGEIIGMKTIEGVSDVTVKDGTTAFSIVKPKSLKVAQVRLENGTVINVTLVNTYGSKLTSPGNDVVAIASSPSSAEVLGNEIIGNDVTTLKGDVRVVTSSGEMPLESGLVVSYSSADDTPDGEIWFVVTTNDPDGIPFYREIELNKELEVNGFTARFDPTDKNNADLNGDYDGDGVPNAVELLIGKDPAKRDILGIELNISVEWKMSEEDKKNLIYSIRKASDFIYDYTDGYAMITRVTIWDDKRNWDKADIWVNKTFLEVKFWGDNKKWPHASVGGYWIGGKLVMPFRFLRLTHPMGIAEMGDIKWAKALGHELGHYVFWLGDEYMDLNGKSYFWDYGLDGPKVDEHAPHSVMHHEWKWSELSTPRDYDEFHEYLSKNFGDWKDHTTDQWLGDMSNLKDKQSWNRSAWETVYTLLTGTNEPAWLSKVDFKRQRPQINIDFILTEDFTPKTGPYTGVGYFMEVTWG
ncbi:lamin tail domain-containing protein [Thermococcus sp. 21S9]|nr:lamin tail domain-containing protein [Thermococcus sp. 21S9]